MAKHAARETDEPMQTGPGMRRPVIGIVMTQLPNEQIQRISCRYLHAVADAGGLPLLMPVLSERDIEDTLIDAADAILMTGGQDILPASYGCELSQDPDVARTVESTPLRDEVELRLLDAVIERGKPCAGICRGMQMMNAYFGGTLYQDLDREFLPRDARPLNPPIKHRQPLDAGGNLVHGVDIKPDTRLATIFGEGELVVNSLHHQGVRKLGNGLVASGVSDDGLVEGIEYPAASFFVGVQWHPEYFGRTGQAMHGYFTALVEAARNTMQDRR